MITQSRSHRELARFELEFIGLRQGPQQIAIAPRRFDAMADVEALMWLQLGVELQLFRRVDAEDLYKGHKERLIASIRYVKDRPKWAALYRGEVEMFWERAQKGEVPLIKHPRRLNSQLFDAESVSMLFHEIGRCFRDGILTMCLAFSAPEQFKEYLRQKLDPEIILNGNNLSGIDLLMGQYLAFLGHAASLNELWEYFNSTCKSNYAISQLREREIAVHNWRLDLSDNDVQQRFEDLTRLLVDGVQKDETLGRLKFETRDLLSQIKAICDSWRGDDDSFVRGDLPGGAPQTKGSSAGQAEKKVVDDEIVERKKPRRAA